MISIGEMQSNFVAITCWLSASDLLRTVTCFTSMLLILLPHRSRFYCSQR